MKPKVIIVNGYPRSGKDTFCMFGATRHNCVVHSTVDTVKEVARSMGWDGEKTPKNRKMLSDLKDFYTKHFDGPFTEMVNIIDYEINYNLDPTLMDDDLTNMIIFHIREPEEIKRVHRWCMSNNVICYSVCISRKETEGEQSNHADSLINSMIYDVYLTNDGSEEEFQYASIDFFDSDREDNMEKYIGWDLD